MPSQRFPITELSADAMSTAADVAAAAASRVPLPAVEVVQHCQLFPKSSWKSAEGSCTSCTVSGPAGVAHLGTEQAVVLAVLPWMPASVVKARMGAGGQRGLLLQLPPPLHVAPSHLGTEHAFIPAVIASCLGCLQVQ